jgi:hypothetical protein
VEELKPFDKAIDCLERQTAEFYSPPRVTVGPEAGSLEFFRAVYRNEALPLSTRMRAAEAALPFEHPKLAAVISTNLSGEDFGAALERARKRLSESVPEPKGPLELKVLPRPGLPK